MKVVILGAGNAATVLGSKIRQAGHEIVQVVSRREEHAAVLASELQCSYSTGWTEIDRGAQLYLIALSDNALYGLAEKLSLPGKLVVHTAGAVSGDVLLGVSEHIGVLYPLQSLRKEIRPYPEVPFLVDAREPADLRRILDFAGTMSGRVRQAGDEERSKLHLAAVMVNNFSNYLYTLAEDYCREEGTDFTLLLPLIRETAGRLSHYSPRDVQTGPAVRRDNISIDKHLSLLSNYKDINELYSLFTKKIEEFYRKARSH